MTTHFLVGVPVVANMPLLYRRFGIPFVTSIGAVLLSVGIVGWAVASEPWQLFAAATLSGCGWGDDGCSSCQRNCCAVVSSRAAGGARDGLQRRQHRRRRVLAFVGRADRSTRVRRRRVTRRCGHDRRHRSAVDLRLQTQRPRAWAKRPTAVRLGNPRRASRHPTRALCPGARFGPTAPSARSLPGWL